MDKQDLLPFKVGQLAESISFLPGYRGAWFRCKIKEIRCSRGEYSLEYFDFPDEKIKSTRIYQVPPTSRRPKEKNIPRQLMVRPGYPPIYLESQMPHGNAISEVTVVISGVWKVGDLVDWFTDGCYWSGRVTQILDNDKVEIELPPPPVGEGKAYKVFCKDLRPSLDWSPEEGWSVPTSKEGENCHCARLIKPVNQAASGLPNLEMYAVDEGIKDVSATAGSPFDASLSSQISANSLSPTYKFIEKNKLSPTYKSKHSIMKETTGQPLSVVIPKGPTQWLEANTNDAIGKTSCSDSVSSSHIRDASAETAGHPAGEDQYYCSGSSKKMRTDESISLNSMCSDTLEAAILDLEELVNRVKWLKGILNFGVPLSHAGRPSWKFMEHRASSRPK
ncbi:uncharacterized protein LOC114259392 isoform X1 [Camellia sinensis]|uniref:uncharacterized protein LOC114259392 isoform X1 n=1 Tax=Camellia sinensis TaxID=4442 RepID=UPI001036050E|nr:uncharacterized protein LOC114259392 isoform X1 [Camellia sinensis]XP_028055201.1 uncharacterized protein LOC114259392 isoform X1 [Camellia sinensis]